MSGAPIVVGTDGSATASHAVQEAAKFARALGAPLHLVMSCESMSSIALASAAGTLAIGAEDGVEEEAQIILDRARVDLAREGVEAVTHVCSGEPAAALVSVADGVEAQMIVVGNRGMSGARRVLGSVPNRVSHHAHCSVMIVQTG